FLFGMVLLFWPRRHREIVYVVDPSQVPEIAARLGISTGPLAAALGGEPPGLDLFGEPVPADPAPDPAPEPAPHTPAGPALEPSPPAGPALAPSPPAGPALAPSPPAGPAAPAVAALTPPAPISPAVTPPA